MKLKDVIDTQCGLRFMVDSLEIQSTAAKNVLKDMSLMVDKDAIESSYAQTRLFYNAFLCEENNLTFKTLQFRLQNLKNLTTTLGHLKVGSGVNDVELFEIKQFALLVEEVGMLLRQLNLDSVFPLYDLSQVVKILDPDGLHIATFYIYDSYSETLRTLRRQQEKNPTDETIFNAICDEENTIRMALVAQLKPYCSALESCFASLAMIDVTIAKVQQMKNLGLCFPVYSPSTTELLAFFHPEVSAHLAKEERFFQPVNILFGEKPVIVTGSNMGGKTVVLKTVGLCQYLFQFGFGIPAKSAKMTIYDDIYTCFVDEQSIQKGLSSFAAEMKHIDTILKANTDKNRVLALIDEPARTTNPTEGTALVSALVKLLTMRNIGGIVVTHYNISACDNPCLRVVGMENGKFDYSLVETHAGEVPHEALKVADSLAIDKEWIELARKELIMN